MKKCLIILLFLACRVSPLFGDDPSGVQLAGFQNEQGTINLWYAPDRKNIAHRYRARVEALFPEVNQVLGTYYHRVDDFTIRLIIPGSREAFLKMIGRKSWHSVVAVAMSQINTIIVDPTSLQPTTNPQDGVLKHELVHLVIGNVSRESKQPIPVWFNEGVAEVVGVSLTGSGSDRFAFALATHTHFRFSELEDGFPHDRPARAELAYEQSRLFIEHLEMVSGRDSIRHILQSVRGGERFRNAFLLETGRSVQQFEEDWIRDQHGWLGIIRGMSPLLNLWTFAIVLLFLALIRERIKRRQIWKRLEEQDARWANPFPHRDPSQNGDPFRE